jgi:hypothetical protein
MNYMTNANFKDYIKYEIALLEKSYESIEKFKYFEKIK